MGIEQRERVWEGVFERFADVPYSRNVFEEGIWTEKLRQRAAALLAPGQQADTAAFRTSDYALPVVAALATPRGSTLRVLDFGGGLATTYLAVRAALPRQAVEFTVVENATLCAIGRELFAGEASVRFSERIPDELFDIAHAGSSLHYVDDWMAALHDLLRTRPGYLLFADLPAGDIQSFVTAQEFHGQRIPVHFWNLPAFVGAVEGLGFDLLLQAPFHGSYLGPNATLPTAHFDDAHRLRHCCQLVFRRRHDRETEQPHV